MAVGKHLGVMGMSTGRAATPPVRLQRTTFQQRARHFHRITLFPPLNHMQRRKATQFIMRQLHRRQCRQEQLAGADHIVVAQHRHLLRYPPSLRQQYLIRQKRYPIVPTHHDIAIAPAGGKMPLQQRYAVAIALIAGTQIEMILPQLFNIAPRFAPGAFQTAAAQLPPPAYPPVNECTKARDSLWRSACASRHTALAHHQECSWRSNAPG